MTHSQKVYTAYTIIIFLVAIVATWNAVDCASILPWCRYSLTLAITQ